MNTLLKYLFSLMIISVSTAECGSVATAFIDYEILPIKEISVIGLPSLIASGSYDNNGNTTATDSASRYSLTAKSLFGCKITAELLQPLPSNVSLFVNFTAPSGATSLGDVQLSDLLIVDVVSNIPNVAVQDLPITYTMVANISTAVFSETGTVRFTIGEQ